MGKRVLSVFTALSLTVAMVVSAPGAVFADAPGGMPVAAAYQPDDEAAKYIGELVAAGLLGYDVYDRPFDDAVTRLDLAKYAMAFYYFIGGADPGPAPDSYIDTDDPNAEKAHAIGLFDDNYDDDGYDDEDDYGGRRYFCPDEDVDKGEALTVLAKAVLVANPAEQANLPSADAALASLRLKYVDANSVASNALPYIGFMDARGAVLLSRDAISGGEAYLHSGDRQSNEEFFLILSDAAWAFAKGRVAPHAVAPAAPKASEYQSYLASAFKNDTNLYWKESSGAYSYNVSVYISKKLKTKLRTGYASLTLNKKSSPTYKSVFGNPKKKKVCYLKVSAADRHGVKSKKTLKVNFYAEKFVNLNQKLFGNKNRFGFKSAKAAKKYQRTVTVKIWKISGGKKVKSKMRLTVNKEVADDVKRIFSEIYKGKEKFPVKEMGGFQIRSSKRSEHNYGTAIDINPTENCMKDGKKVVAGRFWRPGKNKYSIKPDGDVVKAFEKYGWYWGGHGWGDRKDYMHFSYLGT